MSGLRWIGERRGNRVGPLNRSDLAAFRAIGAILLAVAVAVTVYYGLQFDYAAYTAFRGDLRSSRGSVVAVEPTGSYEPVTRPSASRSIERDERDRIVAVQYRFVGPDRVERHGVSYRPDARLRVGDEVTIQYPAGRPDQSRIRGYRGAKFDTVPLGLPILAGAGGVLLLVGRFWRTGRQHASDD